MLLAGAAPARAHIVAGSRTLGQLVEASDLVARLRFTEVDGVLVLEQGAVRRPYVEAELLQLFKGEASPGPLRFVQHGHGVAEYQRGEEALVFLLRIERSRELSRLAAGGQVRWVSLQEHDAKYLLTPASRAVWCEAVSAYVALAMLPDAAARRGAWKRLTLDLLRSPEPRLAASALSDLVLAPGTVRLGADDLPEVLALVRDASLHIEIGLRIGLLAELERRRLVDAPRHWVELLRGTQGTELLTVVQAAGAHPSPPLTAELLRLLGEEDPALVYATVLALGTPGNHAAVAALRQILAEGNERLRLASIRSLGRIATPAARQALAAAATAHPDPATRRRARAELTVLDKQDKGP